MVFQLTTDAPLPVDQENCKELVFEKMEALRKAAAAHADSYRMNSQDQANKGRKTQTFEKGDRYIKLYPQGD